MMMIHGDNREQQIKQLRQETEILTHRLRLCAEQLGQKTMEIERLKTRILELEKQKTKKTRLNGTMRPCTGLNQK
jgi:regulator of replication initiation timing